MFTPARLAVGLEPLSVPGVKRRKPHPFRNDGTDLSVSPLIAPQRVIWQTNCIQSKHPTPQSKKRVTANAKGGPSHHHHAGKAGKNAEGPSPRPSTI